MTPRQTKDGAASKIASLGLVCMLLLEPAGAMAQQAAARQACAADIKQLCSEVKPGEGRLKACVKEHFGQLTASCQTALISNVISFSTFSHLGSRRCFGTGYPFWFPAG